MTGLLQLLSAATVLSGFWAHRPAPRRVQAMLRRPASGRSGRRPTSAARRVGGALVATAATFAVLPALAPIVGVVAWAVPVWRARQRRRAADRAVLAALPEVVDLFSVALGAGLTIPLAIAAVGARAPQPFGAELTGVSHALAAGRSCADALDDAADALGPDARPLLDLLRASARYGAPLGDALARVGGEVRGDRRRRAEASVRRVPVKLLFPLVCCVLPAFALLTVAPLLAGTFGSLRH